MAANKFVVFEMIMKISQQKWQAMETGMKTIDFFPMHNKLV